jgi:hypothetical protein
LRSASKWRRRSAQANAKTAVESATTSLLRDVLTTLCWSTVAITELVPKGHRGDSSTASYPSGRSDQASCSNAATAAGAVVAGRLNRSVPKRSSSSVGEMTAERRR